MKSVVVYYSLEGNVDYVAQEIAQALDADTLRLVPKEAYPTKGFKKFLWGGKSAMMAEMPELEPYEFDADAYDLVVLGFPVWASNVTPPMRSFLAAHDVSAKRVAAFTCMAGMGGEKVLAKLRDCAGVASFEAEMVLVDPKDKPKDENTRKIHAFCDALRAGGASA
jgi:flavodoxin